MRQDVIAHDYQQPLKSSTATAHKAAPHFSCYFSLGYNEAGDSMKYDHVDSISHVIFIRYCERV